MNIDKLLKLIEQGESEQLELKPSLSQINEIIETISAFSNKSGGMIVVGVSNSGKILGLQIGKDTLEQLANKITANTEPKVYPKISTEELEGKKLVVVEVKESLDKPVLAFGRPFKRVGKSTVKMGKDEYERTVIDRRKLYFDSQVCEGASLNDIDEGKLRWFLKEARKQRNLKISEDAPAKEALVRLNLMKDNKLTNASILLFGKEPQQFFLQAEVRCARFKGTEPAKPFIDMKVFGENIIDQADKTLDFVLEHIPLAAWLIPGKATREEKYEYPPDAVREAIVNAICHRDYASTSNIQVRIFDDRIEVWNPGKLPEGWTVETLKQKHESKPFNPLIASQFFLIKLIEKWGTGTNEMIKECLNWGIPEPEFEFTGTSLIVTFRKAILTDEFLTGLGLNDRQKKAVAYMKEHKTITNKKYCELCGVVKDTANRDINGLLDKKLVEKKGSGPTIHYVLRTTVRYRPIPSDKAQKEEEW